MRPRKNIYRNEVSSLEKSNLTTKWEGLFFSLRKYKRNTVRMVVEDGFMQWTLPPHVVTLGSWGRAQCASKAHFLVNSQKRPVLA